MGAGVLYVTKGADDFGNAAALIDHVFREELQMPIAERIAEELATARAVYDEKRDFVLTAEADGKLLGTLIVTHEDFPAAQSARFSWLVVDPAARGQGLGKELLSRSIEACRQRHAAVLRARAFAAAPAAPRLYWRYGFRVVDLKAVVVAGQPREALIFEKRLVPC